jgi:hypothetical protein
MYGCLIGTNCPIMHCQTGPAASKACLLGCDAEPQAGSAVPPRRLQVLLAALGVLLEQQRHALLGHAHA